MINKYVWDIYLKSGGDQTVKLFRDNLYKRFSSDYASGIRKMQEHFCVSKEIIADTEWQLQTVCSTVNEMELTEWELEGEEALDEDAIAQAMKDIDDIFAEEYNYILNEEKTDKSAFQYFSYNLCGLSTLYSFNHPDLFVPYYFICNYNILNMIADAFDIELPELPQKADYRARTWHYANLCKAFYKFRVENRLSYCEFCAFLYDFAPHYIGGIDSYIIRELPEPKAAYFVGGGGNNADAEAENDTGKITYWQCNPATRAGDMIVMYLTFPISAISSVWRSMSIGFIDPFFFYYRCTYIGMPEKITRIPIADIKNDSLLGKMPIVSKNMQGVNGVELRPSEYNYIASKDGLDLPRLENALSDNDGHFANEKEVEEKLIKPLLVKLGFSEDDYVQQMYVEIGNHNYALIPDFVINPSSANGHYSGYAIIEAKRSVPNDKQLAHVKVQARSYAKLLGARFSVIASMEKVWITASEDDYDRFIFEATWESLSDTDVFYRLEKLIGKRQVM